jgi:hypothetical protein
MHRKLSIAFFFFFFVVTSFNVILNDSISEKLTRYNTYHPQEKVYLHLNKAHYRVGDKIWFKAYLVNALSHLSEVKSEVLTIELISPTGEVISQRNLHSVISGTDGQFSLANSLNPGQYSIRAYTNWMRNFDNDYFFRTSFTVFEAQGLKSYKKSSKQKKELQLAFFPEGGVMIVGLKSKVAIKAVNKLGNGVVVSGVILNDREEKVASFRTSELGFATFFLTPEGGQSYRTIISTSTNEEIFFLPEAQENGYSLTMKKEYESDIATIELATKNTSLLNTTLIIHQRGEVLLSETINTTDASFTKTFAVNELPAGVCHLTLFDQQNQPILERMFAVNLTNENHLFSVEKNPISKPESPVEIDLSLMNLDGTELSGELSASIIMSTGVYYSRDQNIQNYMLLSSDLTGGIENASYYFNKSKKAHEELDKLMLTQGWKRFAWEEVLADSLQTPIYKVEKGTTISGQVVDFYNRTKPRAGKVTMSQGLNNYLVVETNENGRFEILDINYPDSADLTLKASRRVNKKGKFKEDVFIKLNKASVPEISKNEDWPSLIFSNGDSLITTDSESFIFLDEVVIESKLEPKAEKDPFYKAKSRYLNPSMRVVADSILEKRGGVKSVTGFLRNIPGIAIIGSGPSQMVRFQGLSSTKRLHPTTAESVAPLYLIDGVPASENVLFSLNPFDISYIDILRGHEAALYGTRGSNGVIAIYLRLAEAPRPIKEPGPLFVSYPGYYTAKKFVYTDLIESTVSDPLGTTVYWNPNVVVEKGSARIKFNVPSYSSNYFLRIEGMAENGSPVFAEDIITINE